MVISWTTIKARLARFLSPQNSQLNEFRSRWGTLAQDEYRDFVSIRALFDFTKDADHRNSVGDNVWIDLELDQVFAQIDTCIGPIGKQSLYRQLRLYETDETLLSNNFRSYQRLQHDNDFREKLQISLSPLSRPHFYMLTDLLFGELPDKPRHPGLIYLMSVASIITLVAMLWYSALLFIAVPLVATNFVIAIALSDRLYYYSRGYSTVNTLLSVARSLGAEVTDSTVPQLSYLQNNSTQIERLRRGFRAVSISRQGGTGALELVFYWLNLICLLDIVLFLRSIDRLAQQRHRIIEVYNQIAFLDAAISISNYMETKSTFCNPVFSRQGQIDFVDVFHPLVEEPVANSLKLTRSSALITGSNMAGKTTMIKTVGINMVLAQTLWMVHAKEATISKLRVSTSIKREDSLSTGKSYYFVEIEQLLTHLRLAKSGNNNIFLLDEIYRGTNTVERISASVAVLESLANSNLVLVTTHDIELQDLLSNYEMFHFRENADASNLFSYKIQDGPCTTRNAIELLKILGYPREVTDRAERLTKVVSKPVGTKRKSSIDD
jgi:MutS-like protein